MTANTPTPSDEQREAARKRLHEARVAIGKIVVTGTGEPMTPERQKLLDAAKVELEAATQAAREAGVDLDKRKGVEELRGIFSRRKDG